MADCLITKYRNQSLWIYTADCIPILIADTKTRNIAACHAGLKGLKKKIISKTLKRLKEIGSEKNNLIIAIGPSISGDSYQVKVNNVNNLIIELTGKKYNNKSSFLIENKEKKLFPLIKKDSKANHLLFDIQTASKLQLISQGIREDQIAINRICTYSNINLFNSWRRNQTSLRQWNCIYS